MRLVLPSNQITGSLNAPVKPWVTSLLRENFFFFFRDKEETPLYKYDVRGDHPQHWVEPELRDRFFLRLLDGEKALLTISPAHLTDEAIYHCRVDFYQSHSRITHVNLTVVGGYNKINNIHCGYQLFGPYGTAFSRGNLNIHFVQRNNPLLSRLNPH